MDKLKNARKTIDDIDAEMAKLFCRRMEASRDVADYKKRHGLVISDPTREGELIARNAARVTDEDIKPYYISFLKNNISLSKSFQKKLLRGMKIAYSGVPGAFGHTAALSIFPGSEAVPYGGFAESYKAVEEGDCDAAVLPIENSFAGDVASVLDLMFFGTLYVTGIYDLEVSQNLVGNPGATVNTVKEVLSHPQALDQCAAYIKRRGFTRTEASNTAVAAEKVALSGRTDLAAIAGTDTARLYNLHVMEANIQESGANTTRFAVFSKAENRPSETDDHFILFFTVKNEAGSLGRAVSVIGENGFNMKALKSRPTKDLIWDYYFFVESRGNIHSEKGQKMLSELSEVCAEVKVAGSFEKEIKLNGK